LLKSLTRLIVYDLDGTLVDSAEIVQNILNDIRRELGKEMLDRGAFIPWVSLGGEDLIRNALGVSEIDVNKYLQEFRLRYFNLPTPQESIYEGALDCLDYLKQENYYLAICTNKPRKLAEKVLNETGLSGFFGYLNAGGDLTTKKPHEQNIIQCLDYFGVQNSQAIMVGDSTVDQELARNASISFVHYVHGYDDGVRKDLATLVLSKHVDLIKFLQINK
jgi:phosphoglycolate phosphatase